MRYDVAVVGLGGMGSAVAAHSAQRGAATIGLEQFTRGHDLGSSSGRSRMIRKAYFEDPAYVPLLLRSYDLWRALEEECQEKLLHLTGLLMVGSARGEIVTGALRAARAHALPIEKLTAPEIRERYPMLQVLEEEMGVFEPDGGVLDPEKSVEAHLRVAEKAGAELRFAARLESWRATGTGFSLRLADGSEVTSNALVLSLGAWFQQTLEPLGVAFRVQRNVQAWFDADTAAYAAPGFPSFLLERAGLPAPLYGFPDLGHGVKAAFHSHGATTDPARLERSIDFVRDIAPIEAAMEQWMPGATARFREAKACLYSLTSDCHFVLDRHPQHPGLILCGGFSGHGFKFAPVIGEVAADLALDGRSRHEIGFFSLSRFA